MTKNQYSDVKALLSKAKYLLHQQSYYASRAQQYDRKGDSAKAKLFAASAYDYRLQFEALKLTQGICLFSLWSEFALEKFNHTKPVTIAKMREELDEFEKEPIETSAEELADIILVAFSSAGVIGVSVNHLMDIINKKADINMSSTWIKQLNGTFKRIKK